MSDWTPTSMNMNRVSRMKMTRANISQPGLSFLEKMNGRTYRIAKTTATAIKPTKEYQQTADTGRAMMLLAEIDEAARSRIELIVRSLAEQNGVTEQLKAENQMEWVRQMNACKAQAEEIVKAELIYD